MSNELAVLALLVFFGLAGGFVLGRNTAGARALAGWLLWLPVPFVILAVVLAGQIDPTLPTDRASYNFAFGFVFHSRGGALAGEQSRRGADRSAVPQIPACAAAAIRRAAACRS